MPNFKHRNTMSPWEREREITINLTLPFLRFKRAWNFPLLEFCSRSARLSELPLWTFVGRAIGSILASIEDMYSRAAVTLTSWRSECNNQNAQETWSAIEKWKAKYWRLNKAGELHKVVFLCINWNEKKFINLQRKNQVSIIMITQPATIWTAIM